jgi:hypothetical protein
MHTSRRGRLNGKGCRDEKRENMKKIGKFVKRKMGGM